MTITTFTKPVCKVLAEEALALLQPLAAKHGIRITIGGGSFDSSSLTEKFVFEAVAEDGRKPLSSIDRSLVEAYGLDPDKEHKDSRGLIHKISGVNRGGSILTHDQNGKGPYRWPLASAQRVFGGEIKFPKAKDGTREVPPPSFA